MFLFLNMEASTVHSRHPGKKKKKHKKKIIELKCRLLWFLRTGWLHYSKKRNAEPHARAFLS